ncbi:MAG: hypothetical protein HYT37_04060 [Candidatus Sungbacteria bacterium]|nr:hypothetical protein [Candidatus Sungbacteria bacterium]
MKTFFHGFAIAVGAGAIAVFFMFVVFGLTHGGFADIASPASQMLNTDAFIPPQKTKEELIAEALEKSGNIKGIYMTADVASDAGAGATRLRNSLIKLAEDTEINGIVIDVKEVCGADFNEKMIKSLLEELHQKNIWAIARIVVMKDASQVEMHPEWYLKRSVPKTVGDECSRKRHLRIKNPNGVDSKIIFWRDNRGGYWLDPASDGVRRHIADFSKKMIDLGFDEIQFDYVRFPSDGDVEKIIYPAWDKKTQKYAVMKSFFEFLHNDLKAYKPDIILSADLFGYAAIREGDVGIGQRLEDIGNSFDYISFMVYPSHYYSGFYLPADSANNLPAVNFNVNQARLHPDVIIGRSLQFARDFLDGKHAATSSSATTTVETLTAPASKARLRPWLEDFYHDADKAAKRPYGSQKVRLQIDAADKTENHGWLLWNAANVYTEGALKKE